MNAEAYSRLRAGGLTRRAERRKPIENWTIHRGPVGYRFILIRENHELAATIETNSMRRRWAEMEFWARAIR